MNKVCGLFDLIVIFSVSLEVFVPTVLDILLELVSVLYEHFNIFTLEVRNQLLNTINPSKM